MNYDARGKLTNTGTRRFCYGLDNRLLGGSTAAVDLCVTPSFTLSYDPIGRLRGLDAGAISLRLVYDGNDLAGEYSPAGVLLRLCPWGWHGRAIWDGPYGEANDWPAREIAAVQAGEAAPSSCVELAQGATLTVSYDVQALFPDQSLDEPRFCYSLPTRRGLASDGGDLSVLWSACSRARQ